MKPSKLTTSGHIKVNGELQLVMSMPTIPTTQSEQNVVPLYAKQEIIYQYTLNLKYTILCSRIRHVIRKVGNQVHSEPTVVAKMLRNCYQHSSKLTTNHRSDVNKTFNFYCWYECYTVRT